jgi:hypothetical protein
MAGKCLAKGRGQLISLMPLCEGRSNGEVMLWLWAWHRIRPMQKSLSPLPCSSKRAERPVDTSVSSEHCPGRRACVRVSGKCRPIIEISVNASLQTHTFDTVWRHRRQNPHEYWPHEYTRRRRSCTAVLICGQRASMARVAVCIHCGDAAWRNDLVGDQCRCSASVRVRKSLAGRREFRAQMPLATVGLSREGWMRRGDSRVVTHRPHPHNDTEQ